MRLGCPASTRLLKTVARAFVCVGAMSLSATPAHATGTVAGTDISNTATATWTLAGSGTIVGSSNAAVVRVNEVLDVTVAKNDANSVEVKTPDTGVALSFTVTNTGNGTEAFRLTVDGALAGDQFDPSNIRLYLDDGDGKFDPATDTLYVAGSNDPVLAPDQSRVVFVVSDIASGRSNGDVALARLTAESVTARSTAGPDTPGTLFAGLGDAGTDALAGFTTALASAQNGYLVGGAVTATLSKTDAVRDSYGNANPIPGATITYTLVFSAVGSGILPNAAITDTVPAGTTYVPGSLTLEGASLTDTADADAGTVAGNALTVSLGNVTAPTTRTVTFKVTLN